MRPGSLPADDERDDQGNVLPVTLGKTDHSCSTAFCNSCAIHCGSLFGGNCTGGPIFTRICQGQASFFPACFSSNNPSILMGTTGTRRLFASRPIPARKGCSLPSVVRSEEHTSELQSQSNLVCRLLLEKKKKNAFFMILHSFLI